MKFVQGLSIFGGLIDEDDFHFACITRLIEFISFEYLHILIAGGHGLLYHHDARHIHHYFDAGEPEHTDYSGWVGTITTGGGGGFEEWCSEYHQTVIGGAAMCGFDSVISLSAESIEAHFIRLIVGKNSFTSLIELALAGITASFGGMRVKLLSKEKALVFVTIKHGEFCLFEAWNILAKQYVVPF